VKQLRWSFCEEVAAWPCFVTGIVSGCSGPQDQCWSPTQRHQAGARRIARPIIASSRPASPPGMHRRPSRWQTSSTPPFPAFPDTPLLPSILPVGCLCPACPARPACCQTGRIALCPFFLLAPSPGLRLQLLLPCGGRSHLPVSVPSRRALKPLPAPTRALRPSPSSPPRPSLEGRQPALLPRHRGKQDTQAPLEFLSRRPLQPWDARTIDLAVSAPLVNRSRRIRVSPSLSRSLPRLPLTIARSTLRVAPSFSPPPPQEPGLSKSS